LILSSSTVYSVLSRKNRLSNLVRWPQRSTKGTELYQSLLCSFCAFLWPLNRFASPTLHSTKPTRCPAALAKQDIANRESRRRRSRRPNRSRCAVCTEPRWKATASPSSPSQLLNLHTHTATLLKQTPHNQALNHTRWVSPVTWIARPVQQAQLDNKNAKKASSNPTGNKLPQ
jgi:hypothetical protein